MSRYGSQGRMDAGLKAAAAGLERSIRAHQATRLLPGDVGKGVEGGEGRFRSADLARIGEMMEMIRRVMFPGFFDAEPVTEVELGPHVGRLVGRIGEYLGTELESVGWYGGGDGKSTGGQAASGTVGGGVVEQFMGRLAAVRDLLALDVQAAYDGDPAARHTDEVILCYPGLDAIFAHRVAHELYRLGVPLLPRVIAEQAHSRTGIDIHPGAQIGERFFVDHGSGTVIGETSVIGRDVKIYQGVTLGARSFPKDAHGRAIKGIKRHPTIGDRVTIYAGAVVLGGDTVIGDDCVIAGGVFVTSSVGAGHVVQQPRADLTVRLHAAVKTREEGVNAKGAKNSKDEMGERGEAREKADIGWLGDGGGI